MSVCLNIIQSGGSSDTQHISAGDTVTFLLASASQNSQGAEAVKGLQVLTAITGVKFVFSAAGNAS